MAKQPLVIVYTPEGKPVKKTRANARDLVNQNEGWTWNPKREVTPASFAPFRTLEPPTAKEPAQAVLDRHGRKVGGAEPAEPVYDPDLEPEVVEDEPELEVEDEEVVDMSAGVEVVAEAEEAPKAKRAARKPKA